MNKKAVLFALSLLTFAGSFWLILNTNDGKTDADYVPPRLKASFAYQAAKWLNDRRAYPAGHIPDRWKEKALKHVQVNNNPFSKSTASVTQLSWRSIGPVNVGGRIRSILIDPLHPDTVYVGSVSGGIWKTTNEGSTWFSTSDEVENLCIGTMVMDPTNPNIIYAGTGEGYFNIDALRGAGVLKSTNGGASWSLKTNFANPHSRYSYYYINKLVIRPDNPNILYAAMIGGIWKSIDAGESWTKLNVPSSSVFCMDLVASPSDPDIMFATFGLFMPDNDGIYKTTDGGSTWEKLTNGLPSLSTGLTRISLAIAPTNDSIVYASISDSLFYTLGILKTTNQGNSWFTVATPREPGGIQASHLGGQGFYNNVIAVHPTNPNIVFAGGINIFKSSNGGTSWSRLIDGNGASNFHVDQHAIAFRPDNASYMYFGNDGGIYRSTNGGVSFGNLNNSLTITQFYSGALHPTIDRFYGGTQDNGTLMASPQPGWQQILSGDGGPVFVDYQDPSNVYMSYVYMTIFKSSFSGSSPERAMSGIPTAPGAIWVADRCSFIAPMAMDPNNPQVLYAGSFRLYKTSNGADSWSAITSDLTGSGAGAIQTNGATITAISVAKSNSSYIYVGTSGWTGVRSRVSVSTNGGSTWNFTDQSPLPNREVTAIGIDPQNANRALAVYSGYVTNTAPTPGHVFLTTNHGSTWTNVSGNLPDVPVNAVLIVPNQPDCFIIGTDLGVFESTNGGATWTQENNGMTNVAVFDLDLRNDGYLLAATHGRGMFLSTSDVYSGFTLYYPANNDSNINTNVTLRWKHSDSTSVYKLELGTDPNFITGIHFSDSTLTDTTKNITGLAPDQKYYWRISFRKSSGTVVSSPISSFRTIDDYPSTFSAIGLVRFPSYSDPKSYNTSHYRLVGLPGGGNTPVNNLLGGVHKTDWQLFWDNGAASEYLVEFSESDDFQFKAGRGFWLVHKGNWYINETVPSIPLDTQGVQIPLHQGWNIITNPYPFTMSWQTIQSANAISELLWGFSGSFASSTYLEPYKGYYFFNANNLTSLTIPYGNSLGKRTEIGLAQAIKWKIDISLESNGFLVENASFGVSSISNEGKDKLDVHSPRSVGDLPSVMFIRPEWDALYQNFATDFKPEFQDKQSWLFTVGAVKDKSAVLRFNGIENISAQFEVFVIDTERGVSQNLRSKASYEYVHTGTERQFEILIGTNDEIQERLQTVTPKSYYLSDNYPNPFNPATTLEYRLPKASHVSFKIFDLLGREIAELVNARQDHGVYTVTWNADNIPSGVYLARLEAGSFVSVKKLLFLK